MKTATFSVVTEAGDRRWELKLPLAPVPGARPRVSRWGAYYPPRYKAWKAEAERMLAAFAPAPAEGIYEGPVFVTIRIVCRRPNKPTNVYPVGDVDNYAKAALDAVTKAKLIWHDDVQVVGMWASKRYARGTEEPHMTIKVSTTLGLDLPTTDVYSLPADQRVSYEELQEIEYAAEAADSEDD